MVDLPTPTPAPKLHHEPLPRFSLVLIAMFAEMMFAPVAMHFAGGLLLLRLLTVVILLGALVAARAPRAVLILYVPLFAAQIAVLSGDGWKGDPRLVVASTVLHTLLRCYVFAFIVRRVAMAKSVSVDTIAGAACAYLMIGIIWGALYFLLELWHPGSFKIPADWIVGGNRDLRSALGYFSFVMLTTVGHVFDVADPATGLLCEAEALFGMLFLAGLIGRIVGLSISKPPP